MPDHSEMKLGKKRRRIDKRTLTVSRYLEDSLPMPPPAVDYTQGITDFGMMLNDKLGCCTIAAVGHAVQVWTRNATGQALTVPDSTIQAAYEKWDGYNPADPNSDQGGVELDVLKNWREQGFSGEPLDAFAAIEPLNPVEMRLSIQLFGGAYIGVELPIRARDQEVWDVPAATDADDEAGSWGGHAIFIAAYDQKTLTAITWGAPKKMTWLWFKVYCSEAYALVSKAWLNASGKTPTGLDLATLEKDLQEATA